jgi:hypothetical protein
MHPDPRDPRSAPRSASSSTPPFAPPPFRPFDRLASERIYDSRWCGLRKDWIRLPDGHEQDYHVFEVDDAVVVVPVFENGDLALLWQYRYVHGKTHWEVPEIGRASCRERVS